MKKIISLICVILLCFSVLTVTACKDDEEIIKFEKTVEANQPISVASLLAEYTEAPDSFTMMYCTFTGISFNKSTITCSDSLEAVPLPTEILSSLLA